MVLLKCFVLILSISYFYCGNKMRLRPCCKEKCCGGNSIERSIKNTNLELIATEKRNIIIIKDAQGNEIINDKMKIAALEKLKTNNKTTDFKLEIKEKIECPIPQYWDSKAHSVRLPKHKLKEIASRAKVESKDSNSGDKEKKFVILENMLEKAIEKLEDVNKIYEEDDDVIKVGYETDGKQIKDEVGYLYTRYISKYNNVKLIKDIFFDFFNISGDELKNECTISNFWQVKKLKTSGGVNTNFKINKFEDTKYQLSFSKETKSFIGKTFYHNVTNTFNIINDNGNLGFDILVSSTANGDPDIYTNIYYSCKYDKSIDTTFFFIISTYYYKKNGFFTTVGSWVTSNLGIFIQKDNTDLVYNQVIDEGDVAFRALFGNDFSKILEDEVKNKDEIFNKLIK